MDISPDSIIFFQRDWFVINATLVYTWIVMAILVAGSGWITRNLAIEPKRMSPWQNRLEILVEQINEQIRGAVRQDPWQFLPFVGTLFIFIAFANVLIIVPGYEEPTGSLSTTTALALCVFVAVPFYGVKNVGWVDYLRHYIQPTPLMLPFNIISEISRTLSLAVRLFGNIMSTSLLIGILVSLVPLLFPVIMRAFGLLIGVIQAYVFAILALIYIASGMRAQRVTRQDSESNQEA